MSISYNSLTKYLFPGITWYRGSSTFRVKRNIVCFVIFRVARALLIKQPSIINDEDESGNSALHLSALNGHHKIIDLLIDYGASVDPRNSVMWTPLDCAAAKGHTNCIRQLLERDAPIDPMDLASITPLHLASKEGHSEVVKLLLEKGADLTMLDHTGKNALDMAVDQSHRYIGS